MTHFSDCYVPGHISFFFVHFYWECVCCIVFFLLANSLPGNVVFLPVFLCFSLSVWLVPAVPRDCGEEPAFKQKELVEQRKTLSYIVLRKPVSPAVVAAKVDVLWFYC